jgi:hypothetical protein
MKWLWYPQKGPDVIRSPDEETVVVGEQALSSVPQLAETQKIDPEGRDGVEWKHKFLSGDSDFQDIWKRIEPIIQEMQSFYFDIKVPITGTRRLPL